MEEKEPKDQSNSTTWFLGKFVRAPAAWLGIGAAVFMGWAAYGANIPIGGAIGFGGLVGFAVGMLSFLIGVGIKVSHQRSLEAKSNPEEAEGTDSIPEKLRTSGLSEDAALFEKLLRDHEAIRELGRKENHNPKVQSMEELVSTIVKECGARAEILQDLIRRKEDPLLESPENADETIAAIRSDWQRAYRAIADVRSLILEGGVSNDVDFLESSSNSAAGVLIDPVSRLEEETALSRRIAERLRPEYESGIVMEDPHPASRDGEWEKE